MNKTITVLQEKYSQLMLWIKKFPWINVITLFLYLFDFNSPEKYDHILILGQEKKKNTKHVSVSFNILIRRELNSFLIKIARL